MKPRPARTTPVSPLTVMSSSGGADQSMATPVERVQGLLGTLRRRWRVALGVLALAVGATLALSMHGVPQYDATAQILLQPPDTVSQTIMPGLIPSSADAQRDVDTNAALITAPPVIRAVRRELHLRVNDRTVADKLTVTGQNDSNLVSITARDPSPKLAQRIATAFAQQYAAYRLTIVQAAVNGALKAGRARLRALKRSGVTDARIGALRARVAELEASAAVQTGGVQVLRQARQPTSAATPQRLRSAIVAAIVGTLVALGAALVLQLTDTRLLTGPDVEAAFEVPVLAVMPPSHRPGRHRSDEQRELYAELAARLGYVGNGGPGVLTVSSSGRGRNGVDVVARLAAQLAALHRHVIVVEAELGVTTAGTNPAEAKVAGLRAVLEGRSSLAQELTQVHIIAGAVGSGRPSAVDGISYQVLPAGGPASNPGALLGRSALGVVLRDAQMRANAVIVQAAAPERVSESLPVAALSDGIVLIAELHRTTRADAAAARKALEGVYGRVLGVIVMPRERRRVASKGVIALASIGVAGGGYAAVAQLSGNRSPVPPAHAAPARADQNRGAKPPVGGGVLSTGDGQCPKEPATVPRACHDRAPADRDGDGMPSRQDRCSNKPVSTPNGCTHHAPTGPTPTGQLLADQATPADRDGDGMPSRQDRCSNKPVSTPNGCPQPAPAGQPPAAQPLPADRDGDGVPDRQDRCPNRPASTPSGCPDRAPADPPPISQPPLADRDGDGVPNGQDRCPNRPASTPSGCPDRAPADPPPASQPPLADRDGDGVPDRQDRCPNRPASTPNGCPDIPPPDPAPRP